MAREKKNPLVPLFSKRLIYAGILGSSASWVGILNLYFSSDLWKNDTKKEFEKAETKQHQK